PQLFEVPLLLEDPLPDRLESRADRGVAGRMARARERLVLPDPGRLLLVALERVERGDEQAGGAAWAQAQVGLEERAGGGAAREPVVEARREARVGLARRLARVVVEKDEVEVGGVAELLAAELAVGDHREPGRALEAPRQARPGFFQRDLEHEVGERREVVG